MASYIDKERVKKTLNLVLDKVKTEADPILLDEYQRLYKKEIALFHRSKVAAYLLMLCDQGKNLYFSKRNNYSRTDRNASYYRAGTDRGSSTAATGAREDDVQRYPLADEESLRLFFSVGRSRRVFPREILGLINTKTAIPREDIGAIRILDNYSFVQVRDTVAEKIINALNGIDFRGRPLTVNYARSRRDEENNAAENEDEYDSSALEQSQDNTEKEDVDSYSRKEYEPGY